jgi:hypothetical protein
MNINQLSSKFLLSVLGIFAILAILVGSIIYLHQKNISHKAPTTQKLSSSTPQSLVPGSKIKGKAVPNAKVTLLITPNLVRANLKTDSSGNYSYTLPSVAPSGTYNLSLTFFDANYELISIKTYPIKIDKAPSIK